MPINESKQPLPLLIADEEINPVELQNRQGVRRETIEDLSPGKYLTILAVETDEALSPEMYMALLGILKEDFGVLGMQTLFGSAVPDESGFTSDLYLTAHLRLTQVAPTDLEMS